MLVAEWSSSCSGPGSCANVRLASAGRRTSRIVGGLAQTFWGFRMISPSGGDIAPLLASVVPAAFPSRCARGPDPLRAAPAFP